MNGGMYLVIACILFTGGFIGWWAKVWNDHLRRKRANRTS